MKAKLEPGALSGVVVAPPSKSYTQRVYAAALLNTGKTIVRNAGKSEDEQAALRVIQQLGAVVSGEDAMEISGVRTISGTDINVGESGLAARLFTPIASIGNNEIKVQGGGSLLRRPMDGFADVLAALNVELSNFNGYLPFSVKGPLKAKSIKVNAGDGSQFLSGLLFALSTVAREPITIEVTDLKSKPYIDMTLDVLARFGKPISNLYHKRFLIDPSVFEPRETVEVDIEGDWSSAAFYLVAGAVAGSVTVKNLNIDSKQADKAIIQVLRMAGADMVVDEDSITVQKSILGAFDFDATDAPDLFPILAILAANCNGESSIRGVHRLFFKESNRVESITEMLQDFAVPFSVEDDTLFVSGVYHLQGTVIDAYSDHRIVMAAAIGALNANGPVEIEDASVISKSYPGFFDDFIRCGGKCSLQ